MYTLAIYLCLVLLYSLDLFESFDAFAFINVIFLLGFVFHCFCTYFLIFFVFFIDYFKNFSINYILLSFFLI